MKRLLAPLAEGFRFAVAVRRTAYRRGWLKTYRLDRPVVSVGNLTAGGTGKTPLVRLIAEQLLTRGWKPSILTRGYGRRRGPSMAVLEPATGPRADPREVGDEPALLARALPGVPIVVCADRYRAGRVAEERFHVNVHILDDGFQHWALARNVDVVTVDVTQELSDRALLPAGRQRESPTALVRAHIVVLTRTELADSSPAANRVREVNPQVRIFLSTTGLSSLIDVAKGETRSLQAAKGKPVAAFCGVGNPRTFFMDLRRWGFDVITEAAFPDHYVYSVRQLHQLGARAREAGAEALLTTEKDAVNFPVSWSCDLPILVCAIHAEVRAAEGFMEAIVARLEAGRRNTSCITPVNISTQ